MNSKMNPTLAIAHFIAALSIPAVLALLLSGCLEREGKFLSVEPGPIATQTEILMAVNQSFLSQDPNRIQIGQFVHTEEFNEIGGGAARGVIADMGQTVVERTETTTAIDFKVIETRIEYVTSQESRTASVERSYHYDKPAAQSSLQKFDHSRASWDWQVAALGWFKNLTGQLLESVGLDSVEVGWGEARAGVQTNSSPIFRTLTQPKITAQDLLSQQFEVASKVFKQEEPSDPLTYHDLKVKDVVLSPPTIVQRRPNCGGIPNCQIRALNITFDIFLPVDGVKERVHYEFVTSHEVPWFATTLRNCLTMMVPISKTSKTLLKQCSRQLDFRFESEN